MQQVLESAGYAGRPVHHTHDSRRSAPGFPDLLMVRPPEVPFAVLRTDTGMLRPEQCALLEALERCEGVEACLWRPSSWPERRYSRGR